MCFGRGKIHLEYAIMHDIQIASRPVATDFGAVLIDNPDPLQMLSP